MEIATIIILIITAAVSGENPMDPSPFLIKIHQECQHLKGTEPHKFRTGIHRTLRSWLVMAKQSMTSRIMRVGRTKPPNPLGFERTQHAAFGEEERVFYANSTNRVIHLTEGSALNLTCSVLESKTKDIRLSWYIPSFTANSQKRLSINTLEDGISTNIVISPVSETDSGQYKCEAITKSNTTHLKKVNVSLVVEPDWGICNAGFYQCAPSIAKNLTKICIKARYRCDGIVDCPMADDESHFSCGLNPCEGKISCPDLDHRCIDPKKHCCDPDTDPNCEILYSCCKAVLDFSLVKNSVVPGGNRFQHPREIHHIDKVIYACIGSMGALLFACLVIIVAKRYQSLQLRRIRIYRHQQRPPITLHDLDMMYGDTEDRGNFNITLNINHGVQIMRPPPYPSVRYNSIRGPPPPYMSQEDLMLLTENNNNGDINGNSAVNNNLVAAAAAAAAAEREAREGGAGERPAIGGGNDQPAIGGDLAADNATNRNRETDGEPSLAARAITHQVTTTSGSRRSHLDAPSSLGMGGVSPPPPYPGAAGSVRPAAAGLLDTSTESE